MLVGLALAALFILDVHWRFGGHVWETLKFGIRFGVTAAERSIAIRPNYIGGHDGQFYYLMSNDPLGSDPETLKVIGVPGYWYQRVFIPLVIHAISRTLGFPVTPPVLYHCVQFLMVLIGFGVLVKILIEEGRSAGWAMTWLLGGATIPLLFSGLLDPVADSLFILVLVSWRAQRWKLCIGLLTALVLTRESYWLLALGLGAYRFAHNGERRRDLLLISVPLLAPVLVYWACSLRFGAGLFHWQKSFTASSWGFWEAIQASWQNGDGLRVILLVYSAALMGTVLCLARKKRAEALVFLPHAVMYLLLSQYQWEVSGLKFLGPVVLLVIWCAKEFPRWAATLAAINLILGGVSAYAYRDTPDLRFELVTAQTTDYRNWESPANRCEELRGRIEIEGKTHRPDPRWLWPALHREFQTVNVRVWNEGSAVWVRSHPYLPRSLYLTYGWLKDGRSVLEGQRIAMPTRVAAGSAVQGAVEVRLPQPGPYQLQFFLAQSGCEKSLLLSPR